MKAAEETLKYITQMGYTGGIEAIKAYGRQCAEQALKDAARTTKHVYGIKVIFSDVEQKAIESTPIVTP